MFRNTKKQNLIIIVEAKGETVPDKTNIVQLKQIIENIQAVKDDLEFVTELITSIIEQREKRQSELEKLKLILVHEESKSSQAAAKFTHNGYSPKNYAEFIEQVIDVNSN